MIHTNQFQPSKNRHYAGPVLGRNGITGKGRGFKIGVGAGESEKLTEGRVPERHGGGDNVDDRWIDVGPGSRGIVPGARQPREARHRSAFSEALGYRLCLNFFFTKRLIYVWSIK